MTTVTVTNAVAGTTVVGMATVPDSKTGSSIAAGERRTHKRLATGCAVYVTVTDGSNRTYAGQCVDVSVGGFGIELEATLSVGEVIEISFDTTESHASRYRGRVIYRTNQRHYGVALLAVTA